MLQAKDGPFGLLRLSPLDRRAHLGVTCRGQVGPISDENRCVLGGITLEPGQLGQDEQGEERILGVAPP